MQGGGDCGRRIPRGRGGGRRAAETVGALGAGRAGGPAALVSAAHGVQRPQGRVPACALLPGGRPGCGWRRVEVGALAIAEFNLLQKVRALPVCVYARSECLICHIIRSAAFLMRYVLIHIPHDLTPRELGSLLKDVYRSMKTAAQDPDAIVKFNGEAALDHIGQIARSLLTESQDGFESSNSLLKMLQVVNT